MVGTPGLRRLDRDGVRQAVRVEEHHAAGVSILLAQAPEFEVESRLDLMAALAGSLAAKKATAVTAGTLPTHTPLFITLLVGVVLMVGALTFVPALALGPIVEHLQMGR